MADNTQTINNSKDQLAHITEEMYVKNMELAVTNKTLSLLRKIDELVLDARGSLKDLSGRMADAIENTLGASAVILLSKDHPEDRALSFQGWAVRQEAYDGPAENLKNQLETLTVPLDSDWLIQPSKTLIIDVPRIDSGFGDGPLKTLFQDLSLELGVKVLYLTKLQSRNTLVGVMCIGLSDSGPKLDDIGLYERLSEAVGVAMDNKLLFDENQRVAKALAVTNQRLKELDATKDEFISMASHQLRTPLTAIKGYVSMVMDGDFGKLADQQKEMLKRAFDASQKMVYMIADLLNVSRLQSGKFIIDNKPTNLAEVVASEVDQLRETAAQKQVNLTYNQPASFPTLMLDDEKIRQVITNLVDNAIYYTPSGGKVIVNLQATDNSAIFTVVDTGLGVPKNLQVNLFKKFYRADNARQVRPDGTGLGLYLVKKVVTAQGGGILFSSEEGKGSTFGFVLPLNSAKPAT